jgi:hypothetical protein
MSIIYGETKYITSELITLTAGDCARMERGW